MGPGLPFRLALPRCVLRKAASGVYLPPPWEVRLMRFAAVLLVAIVYVGAIASQQGDPLPPIDPATADLLKEVNRAIDANFKVAFPLWKHVKCVTFKVDYYTVTGEDGVPKMFRTEDLRDYMGLRLANDLSFVPVCQGDIRSLPSGTVASLSVDFTTVGHDYPVAYNVEIKATILGGATVRRDCEQKTDWDEETLGFAAQAKLQESFKHSIQGNVEAFARFLLKVRSTDFNESGSSSPKGK
jgi:hypothetical protein